MNLKIVLPKYGSQTIEIKLRLLSNFAKNICENFQGTVLLGCVTEWHWRHLLNMPKLKRLSGALFDCVQKDRVLRPMCN